MYDEAFLQKWLIPVNTLHKSNVILWSYFGILHKLLSANVDVTKS